MKQNFTVRQGALDGVEAFLSVARHRSFRRAAAELGVTPSAISQAVRALEARIGAALFVRTTRSVGMTEAGQRFLSRAKPAFEELIAASGVASELGQRPAGLLRLSVPRAVVPILLEPLIASFCQAYPEVEVEIAASEELVDIAAGGFDAGIRLGQFIEADMIAVRLTPSHPLAVVGSPDYLRRRKQPELIDDLTALIKSWGLDGGTENSLLTKVRPSCSNLSALANEVSAQTNKKLSMDQGNSFNGLVTQLSGQLGCSSTMAVTSRAKTAAK